MGFNQIGSGLNTIASPSSAITLLSGQYQVIPAGQWRVQLGRYSVFQWYDPVSTTWRNCDTAYNGIPFLITADGYNTRIINLTGTVVGGVVTNAGTANTAKNGFWPAGSLSTVGCTATTTAGGGAPAQTALFNTIVGGAISTTITVTSGGSGYTMPPIVMIDPPPLGGLQATAVAVLTAGVVTSFTVTNQGAGYVSVPAVTIKAVDTGAGAVGAAAIDSGNNGKLVAVTMASYGGGYAAVPTVTQTGITSAAITAVTCLAVITAPTVASATGQSASQLVYCAQKTAAANITTNPAYSTNLFQVRNGLGVYNTSATLATQLILDGGMSQLDCSNLCLAILSPTAASGTATYSGGASGGVTDVSYAVPV